MANKHTKNMLLRKHKLNPQFSIAAHSPEGEDDKLIRTSAGEDMEHLEAYILLVEI